MGRTAFIPGLLTLVFVVGSVFLTACKRADQTSTNSSSDATNSAAPSPKTGFEADLDWMRKGQYTYIWVLSRKDGKPIDKDDAAYLRQTAPQIVDAITTDEGRKVIVGTNFDLAQGNLPLLQKRFNTEDYSAR